MPLEPENLSVRSLAMRQMNSDAEAATAVNSELQQAVLEEWDGSMQLLHVMV